MHFDIKNRFSGAVLFSCELAASFEAKSFRVQLGAAVQKAVSARANLAGAYLARAYLAGANLAGANLAGANLARANLAGAYLAGANLARAYLAGANLADAYLASAYLARANFDIKPATPEEATANLDRVREIILDNEALLEMSHWHEDEKWQKRTCAEEAVCGTTHCLAGWLQVCSTDEKIRKLDPQLAGTLLAPPAARLFLSDSATVLKFLREREYAEGQS